MTNIVYAQSFCTAAELENDLNLAGSVRAELLLEKIEAACDVMQKRVGWFVPVTMTKYFNGMGRQRLHIHPFLGLTGSIVNDGTTLTGTDYILQPNTRWWANGPYSWLDVAPDAANLSEWIEKDEGVEVPARWGLYEETESTAATVQNTTSQSDTVTTLLLSDGSKVSPGMVLLIGTEQEYVSGWGDPTSAVTTLGAGVDATSVEWTLSAGALNVGEIGRVGLEQFKVLDKNGTAYYVQRGWNKSRQAVHAVNADVDVYRSVNVVRGVNGTTAAAHLNGASIARYKAPSDVNYLCRQIAALMLKKAQGGFAGKTGNEDTGQTTYNNEFPMIAMREIEENYRIHRVG